MHTSSVRGSINGHNQRYSRYCLVRYWIRLRPVHRINKMQRCWWFLLATDEAKSKPISFRVIHQKAFRADYTPTQLWRWIVVWRGGTDHLNSPGTPGGYATHSGSARGGTWQCKEEWVNIMRSIITADQTNVNERNQTGSHCSSGCIFIYVSDNDWKKQYSQSPNYGYTKWI
jgi:hypothetical protein